MILIQDSWMVTEVSKLTLKSPPLMLTARVLALTVISIKRTRFRLEFHEAPKMKVK